MASTTAAIDLPVPPERVWQLIGGFNSLPDWLPYIALSVAAEGGRVRHLENADGDAIVERLVAFDDSARSYSYAILEAPFPVTGYLSTLKVQEIPGRPDASRVVWSGTFTPAGVSAEEAVGLFQGIYSDGLAALRETLAA
jgi:hypothetical protein